jgi:hypothetical protein
MKKFFFLNLIRKSLKSLGKKEEIFDDLITYKFFHKNILNKIDIKKTNFEKFKLEKFKIVVTITFLYDQNKIDLLAKVCQSLNSINKNVKIFIITNEILKQKIDKIYKKINFKVKIIKIDNLINNRLLPWYHIEIMKKQFKDKNITHFINIEDDIILNKENFIYWVNARKLLKKFKLIPGFVRTERNHKDKEIYLIDILKTTKISRLPKFELSKEYCFLNHKFPYQGLYLYDRDLMKEYLSSPATNPDCGHGGLNLNYLNKKMINHSLLEKANLGLTYIHLKKGFHNRIVILFDRKNNSISKLCCVKHLPNKYTNENNSVYGKMKFKDAFY